MKTYYLSIVLTLLWGLPLLSQTQNKDTLSLVEVLEKVKANNLDLQMANQDLKMAEGDHLKTRSAYLPQLSLSYTGITTNNPITAFGSKLNQAVISQSDFDPELLNNPDRITNFATSFEIQQPIFNMDGLLKRQAAASKLQAVRLKNQFTQNQLMFEAESAYLQLQLAYKNKQTLEKVREVVLANKELAENNLNQGLIQGADLLAVEVRLNEVMNQLHLAESNIQNASENLAFLMGSSNGAKMIPTDSLKIKWYTEASNLEVPGNRPDIAAMEVANKAQSEQHKADKMSGLPRLNAFGSYELYDNNAFGWGADGYIIGLQLSWNIFDGGLRQGQIEKSKASYEKSKLQYQNYLTQSQKELNQTIRALKDAQNQINLAENAIELARESLRIRTNRFEQGLEKTSDLLTDEGTLAQKQMEFFHAVYLYNYHRAKLQLLSQP